jgi:thioredoxin 1
MVVEIETKADLKNIIDRVNPDGSDSVVLIDFFAPWCGPCIKFAPHFEQLSKKYPDITFCKINIEQDELSEFASACEISALPTFCLFINGTYVNRVVSADGQKLEKLCASVVPKSSV